MLVPTDSVQSDFNVRMEWGRRGIEQVANHGHITVVVDVLSFSTCVDIAVARGVEVFPFAFKDERAGAFALEMKAVLASPQRSKTRPSLSPTSLLHLNSGSRLVLPSPNGSTLSRVARSPIVLAGCLRNAMAVAEFVNQQKCPEGRPKVTVIAAAEHWNDDSPRFALEDLLGAGAIIAQLSGSKSPEALMAMAAFAGVVDQLFAVIDDSTSGKELKARGFAEDNRLAAALNVSNAVPRLSDGCYRQA